MPRTAKLTWFLDVAYRSTIGASDDSAEQDAADASKLVETLSETVPAGQSSLKRPRGEKEDAYDERRGHASVGAPPPTKRAHADDDAVKGRHILTSYLCALI